MQPFLSAFGAPLATSGGFGFGTQPGFSAFGAPSATSGGFGFGTQPGTSLNWMGGFSGATAAFGALQQPQPHIPFIGRKKDPAHRFDLPRSPFPFATAPASHESAGFGTAPSFGFPPAAATGFAPPAFGSNSFSFASIQAAAAAAFRAPTCRNNSVVPTSKTGGSNSVLVGHLAQEIVDRINKLEYNDWKEKVFGYFSRKSIQAQSDSNMMDEDFGDKLLALLKHLEVLAKISVLKLVVWKAKCRLHSSDENADPLGAVMWYSKGWKKVKQHYVDDAAIETVAKLIRPWLGE
ncbi:hypothetical protein MPSEU_000280500 [Mayamaea pseudoterrestris]|nr:hypothetical protein MPSEU_000280500 [Mayamaea pseudoterrestris]